MKTRGALVGSVGVLLGGAVAAQGDRSATPSLLEATFGKLPLYLVENRGRYPDEVAYYIQGADKTHLVAIPGAHFPYQLGSSLGTGPIPIDTRQLGLSPDDLLVVIVNNYWPAIFSGYRGVISATGQAQAAIHIPNLAALIGVRLHTALVTLDPQAPSGIRAISNTFSFTIAP